MAESIQLFSTSMFKTGLLKTFQLEPMDSVHLDIGDVFNVTDCNTEDQVNLDSYSSWYPTKQPVFDCCDDNQVNEGINMSWYPTKQPIFACNIESETKEDSNIWYQTKEPVMFSCNGDISVEVENNMLRFPAKQPVFDHDGGDHDGNTKVKDDSSILYLTKDPVFGLDGNTKVKDDSSILYLTKDPVFDLDGNNQAKDTSDILYPTKPPLFGCESDIQIKDDSNMSRYPTKHPLFGHDGNSKMKEASDILYPTKPSMFGHNDDSWFKEDTKMSWYPTKPSMFDFDGNSYSWHQSRNTFMFGFGGLDWMDIDTNSLLTESVTRKIDSLNDSHKEDIPEQHSSLSEKMQNESESDTEPDLMHKELKVARHALHATQSRLHDYQVKTNVIVTSLKAQLYKKEHEMRWQREHHEQQAKKIVSNLLFLEGQLRKDQKQILQLLRENEKLVQQQKTEIETLRSSNLQLLAAIKEFHIPVGSNGVHGHRVIQDDFSLKTKTLSDFDRNRAHKKKFTEMRERLRRHRSSFELHNPEPLETLEESGFRYGSQDNISDFKDLNGETLNQRRMSMPCQKERPRSLTDFPHKITEYPLLELHKECDLKIEDLEIEEEDKNDDDIFVNGYIPSQMTKSNTVPSEMSDIVNCQNSDNKKQRPLSESSLDLISLEKVSKSQSKSPSQRGQSQGETNPFKSIKTMLRRKGNKLKNKKRSVSLPQGTNQEYSEALKKHFDKYGMS